MRVYLLQINYKSGISMKAEFVSFSFDGFKCEWKVYTEEEKVGPYFIGADDIESVWQLGEREV